MSTSKSSKILAEIKSLLYIGIIALVIRIFIFEPYFVPTESMVDTILKREYLFATKYSYGFSKYSLPINLDLFQGRILDFNAPKRGDVVIFYLSNTDLKRFVKRVIGLPGDAVQMIDGDLYINGKKAQKEYVGGFYDNNKNRYNRYKETLPNGVQYEVLYMDINLDDIPPLHRNTGIFHVPQGHYFCMGDNRDNSNDSRFELSYIPHESLIGKAQFIFFSTEKLLFPHEQLTLLDQIKQIPIWIQSIRIHRLFKSLVPDHV